jgi:adenine phosphoribosyltransferase
MKNYEITIAGVTRSLPLCSVNEKLDIAAFIIFSDVELTIAAASELLRKAPEFDIILTPEAKSIPLAYEMARQSGKNYIVARKSKKLYLQKFIRVEVKSITTNKKQKLFLSKEDALLLKDKNVLIVDDVISTGGSLLAVEKLLCEAGGKRAGACAVLAEGVAADRKDIFFLEPLPLFFKK